VELATSRNTVEGAYQELYAEGYIYSKPRSGYFVSPLDQESAPLSLVRSPRALRPMPESPERCSHDFHPARLDRSSFPVALWRRLFTESLRQSPPQLVQYGDPQGEPGLRFAIQRYLERSRGVVCDPEQIVLCGGLQQSLDIVATLLQGSRPVVAVEDPGYHLPRAVFRNHGFPVVPVPVGAVGLDLDALNTSGATIAYVTPSHQLPMGCVMPVANRLTLIEWAEAAGRLIIEDDYDSELRYQGKPIPSLQGLRPSGSIVYLGTFSKILSPALRVSYLVLPPALLDPYRRVFRDYFATVPLLEQNTLAKFMEQGHWDRHVRRMRTIYRKKHDALLRGVERHFPSGTVVHGQGAGLHVVVQLADGAPEEGVIMARAREKGLGLLPLSGFSVTAKPAATRLLLGFGGMSPSEIEEGIALLAPLCR
jgi:GntR family transcriptional regulator/MocR family aminotransferase